MKATPHLPRRLGLAIALALAVPGLALAQSDRYQEQSARQQEQRDARYMSQSSDRDRQMDQRRSSEQRYTQTGYRKQLKDRPGQSATDARREAVVWTSFALNDQLRESELDVEVRSGRAKLSGMVESQVERDLAEQIALSVEGIERIDNQIRIDANYRPVASRMDRDTRNLRESDRDFSTSLSDATTTAKVKSKLLWNTRTDGLDISVDTLFGRVTLTGTADSQSSKSLAERIARDTEGVVSVENRLNVSAEGIASTPAEDRATYISREDREERRIREEARTGERTAFESDLDETARVDRESEGIDRPDGWITTKVKSTLLFSRSVDGFDIDVSTSDGVVMLKGNVDTQQEKQLAVQLARDVVGVRRVDASQLAIAPEERVAGQDYD